MAEKDNTQNRSMNRGPMGNQGRGTGEKANNFGQSISKLFKYLKPYYNLILIAVVFAATGSIFTIIGPDHISELTSEIINGIMTGINFANIKSIGLFLLTIYSLSAVFSYAQSYIMATVTNKFSLRLRNEISEKINRLPLKYFDTSNIGDTLSRVTNDVDTMGQAMNNSIASLVSAVTLFFGLLFMMFKTNWIMATTAILATIFGFGFMIVIMSKSQKYFDQQQKQLGYLNGHIEEIYSGHTVVKLYNGADEANDKFDEINNNLYHSARMSQFMSGLMMPIMSFIGNFGYVAVCLVGSYLVMEGIIEIGTIVAFMLYVRLFTSPLTTFAQSITQLQSAAAASERVFEFLEEEELADQSLCVESLNPQKVSGDIDFEHVVFGYEENKTIIKDFNAVVKAGQKVAIVGPTGAGKTTMVNLLMKFYETNSGDIKIDGVSTKSLTRENIHDMFIMVLQDTWLFEGTIKENIVYNKKGITDQQVVEVCKVVGIDHFIRTLPQGYDTVLTDTESISAGQKQLMTIARAMISDAPFLILDEATSSVDTRTERLVQAAMDKLTEEKTSFIIAHRLSTIKNADLILVMKDGNIIENGDHEGLLKKNGFYAELYNSQFQTV